MGCGLVSSGGGVWGLALSLVGAWVGMLGPAQGQSEWRWSHPWPHGNNIVDLAHRDGLYVQVTDHGGIYTSTNRVIWERRESGTLLNLRAVAFFGGRVLVTGEAGTALWSDDGLSFQAATLDPPTEDWLEGVAAGGEVAVAVGDNGAVYRTTDGQSWSRVSDVAAPWLSGVTYGQGQFVAVGEAGYVATSIDGSWWVSQDSGTGTDLSRIAFADSEFVAVGRGGLVLTSLDGFVWSPDAPAGATNDLYTVAGNLTNLVVGGASSLWLREGRRTWVNQLLADQVPAPAPAWTYAGAIWDGERFMVAGRTGVAVEGLLTNAFPLPGKIVAWNRLEDSPRNGLWSVERLGGAYLAAGDRATVLSSLDGAEWALEYVPVDVGGVNGEGMDTIWWGLGGDDERAYVVGSGGAIFQSRADYAPVLVTNSVVVGGGTYELVSSNRVPLIGLSWERVVQGETTNTLQGIAVRGDEVVIVGAQGTILHSLDGVNWSRSPSVTTNFLSSVAAFDAGWVACGQGGVILSSADGDQWAPQNPGVGEWVYRVRHWGGQWVAVGEAGLILSSANGIEWHRRSSGVDAWLTDVRRLGDQYFVCGTQGVVLRSGDLDQWTEVPLLTGKALYGLARFGGQLVAVGAEGIALRTLADSGWSPVAVTGYRHDSGVAGVPVDLFRFDGVPEQPFRLEAAGVLGGWAEVLDLRLDLGGAATAGRESAEAIQFYRTASGGESE